MGAVKSICQKLTCRYSKTCLKQPLKRIPKIVFSRPIIALMQVKGIAKCSKGSILQYFQSSLSYHLSLRPFVLSIFE